jgi:hypothetical protein
MRELVADRTSSRVDGTYARHPCGSARDTFLKEADGAASPAGRGHGDANGAINDNDAVDEAEIDDVVTKLGIDHDPQCVADALDELVRHDGGLTRSISARSPTAPCPHRAAPASEAITQALLDAGYVRIGLDHFALPSDSLAIARQDGRLKRNFQGYTDDSADTLIGLGASAIGRMPQGFVQNAVATRDYLTRIAEDRLATSKGYMFTGEDRFRADIIERIMCDLAVCPACPGCTHLAHSAATHSRAV